MKNGSLIPIWVQCVAFLAGLVLTATGAVAVFVTSNSAGAATLVATGAAVSIVGLYANRIQSIEGGGVRVQLAEAVIGKLQAAEEAEQGGQPELAQTLRNDAERLMALANPVAGEYESIRRNHMPGDERTRKLERIVVDARRLAPHVPDSAAVERLFDTGQEGNRLTAIAIMQARPELASLRVASVGALSPMSAFEQFHALALIDVMSTSERWASESDQLRSVVERALQDERVQTAVDRKRLATRILRTMDARLGGAEPHLA